MLIPAARFAFASLGLLVLGISGCAGGAATDVVAQAAPQPFARPLAGTGAGHVYVLDPAHRAVLAYPIAGGVVSTTSDSQLDVTVPSGDTLSNISVDATGNLYVLATGANAQVAVYAPGSANGASASRVLALPFGYAAMTVDGPGNVYYANNVANLYGVYAPGSSGSAAPIGGFRQLDADVYSMSVAGSTLYTTSYNADYAYSNAITAPAPVRQYCIAHLRKRFTGGGSAVIDPVSNRLFADEEALVATDTGAAIAIFPAGQSHCPYQARLIHVRATTSGKAFNPGELQFFGGYLLVFDFGSNTIYQIAARSGIQAPVVTLGPFVGPVSFAVGP